MVFEGSMATISCFTDTMPLWTKDYKEVDASMHRLNFILIRDVSDKDSGKYTCVERGITPFHESSDFYVGGIPLV